LKINILNTPGYYEYFGKTTAALTVVETALIVVKLRMVLKLELKTAGHIHKTKNSVCFVINKADLDQSKFEQPIMTFVRAMVNLQYHQYPLTEGNSF